MAKKLGKFLAFCAAAGAIAAAVYYFFVREEDDVDDNAKPKENEIKSFFEEMPAREYVSLNRESEAEEERKEAIREKIDQAAKEQEKKEQEEKEGVGLVKEEVKTSDFAFEDLEGSEEEDEKDA